MDKDNDTISSDSWNFEDELEPSNLSNNYCSDSRIYGQGTSTGDAEGSTSNPVRTRLINHFMGMGFSEDLVVKAVEEYGEENTEIILENLLTHSALEESPPRSEFVPPDLNSSEIEWDSLDDLSDADSSFRIEEDYGNENKLLHLVDMGFSIEEASSAIDACDPDTSITDLMDYICAAGMAESECIEYHADQSNGKKRKLFEEEEAWERKKDTWRRNEKSSRDKRKKLLVDEGDEAVHLPKVMIGFGVPNGPRAMWKRNLPEAAVGPPFFYYENVACTPKGVWSTISRFLYDIEPEFVDSMYFCATVRKRGYIHNLPIANRFPLLPLPPRTIQEALPMVKKWWPSWDVRTRLNCLNTCTASAKLTERIRKALERCEGTPPLITQKFVLYQCRKWNLVWTGKNKVAALEPEEIEMLMGYPRCHTRGGGTSRTERFKALGNSFQVDTVAYHLSVLKDLFPSGISVLSLFSGIGGAEVALHRLGIRLKNVVSVELSEVSRNIFRSWWEETEQKGNLIEFKDIQDLTADKLEKLVNSFGGFDLIIGGSPCNNLTGNNRISRSGLNGEHSILFYEYFRILDAVKCFMAT